MTTGASSDIQQATRLAKVMVTKFGLNERIGLFYIDEKDESISTQTKIECDDEIKKLLKDSYSRAKNILETNKIQLDRIAHGLLEYESLSGSEIVDLMEGKKINTKKIRSQKPSRELSQNVPITKTI